jgi:3-isopropylmalate/(R)-2-methylmalate dehydratase large subunit
MSGGAQTLFAKIWNRHLVKAIDAEHDLLYVDQHLVNEVTSPQAFEGLRNRGLAVARPAQTLAVAEHNVSTTDRTLTSLDPASRHQIETLERNCWEFGVEHIGIRDLRQGIVHMIGLEQGLTQPGMLIACGDSHTSSHGAFGALGLGIGTSEVEHVLATQTLVQRRPHGMRVRIDGALPLGVTAKDMILHVIGRIGITGASGHVIEFDGTAVRALPLGGRITLCNMSIEAGARSALIAADKTVWRHLFQTPLAPPPALRKRAIAHWRGMRTDPGARFDSELLIDVAQVAPQVTWGVRPDDVLPITGCVPDPDAVTDPRMQEHLRKAIAYQGLQPGMPLTAIPIDKAFIGSCTNATLDDLRSAAAVLSGRRVADHVEALVVPGSTAIKRAAEAEGLATVFRNAGFQWRESGCSLCLGMNPDRLGPGERCASSTNRNFEHRQGPNGRTHLMSPAMVAAAAVAGRLADVRALMRA